MKKRLPHSFDYYVLLFFTVAFLGWLWEILLYLATAHSFVNRGVYRGPYLPIYGIGGIIIMLALYKLRRHPFYVFFISSVLCTILEYCAGAWLEWKFGIRWWDYSGHLGNINGYVCLTSSIGFGLGGILIICIFQPIFNKIYHSMTIKMRIILCIVCLLIFVIDATYSISKPNTGQNINALLQFNFIAL